MNYNSPQHHQTAAGQQQQHHAAHAGSGAASGAYYGSQGHRHPISPAAQQYPGNPVHSNYNYHHGVPGSPQYQQVPRYAGPPPPVMIQQAPNNRIPTSSAPSKCRTEMKESEFRTWVTSMKTWLRLSHYPEADKPGLIRLQCTDDL